MKALFYFSQGYSSPLCVLKQSSDQVLHLRTGELQRQRAFCVSPPEERNQGQIVTHVEKNRPSFI